ncbi:hypothetical protein SAMN04487914_15011 [Arthrobacter sp. ok909]|jgi:hypothetical protein|nr:hypothetical protein SAMN04487914_15011 [Arthrobacter sp. ok909]
MPVPADGWFRRPTRSSNPTKFPRIRVVAVKPDQSISDQLYRIARSCEV